MYLPVLLVLSYLSTYLAKASQLGTQNIPCDPGWSGPTCNTPNYIPRVESPQAYYDDTIYIPGYSSWGGSFINTGVIDDVKKKYWIGSLFTNELDISCWPYTSGCAAALSINDGPYHLLGFIGSADYTDNINPKNAKKVPWCHNAFASMQYTLSDPKSLNGRRNYALRVDAIWKREQSTNKYMPAFFGAPNRNICDGYVMPFPKDKFRQDLFVAYKEFDATTEVGAYRQLRKFLESTVTVTNVNDYNATAPVYTNFTWDNLRKRITNPYQDSVNPAPLMSTEGNYPAFVADNNGNYQSVLFYRFIGARESIGILFTNATSHVWNGGKYLKSHEIRIKNRHIEDPYAVKRTVQGKQRVCLFMHDFVACKAVNKQSCASITCFDLDNSKGLSMLSPSAAAAELWPIPSILFSATIPGLKDRTKYRQRPYADYENGTLKAICAGTVFEGKIIDTPNGLRWQGKRGTGRDLCVAIRP